MIYSCFCSHWCVYIFRGKLLEMLPWGNRHLPRWRTTSTTKNNKRFTKNTVVSNHFHSVKFFLFSSRDFDGLIGIELPVSMYTTKTPIDLCRFNVRSSKILTFSVKDRYQLNYLICIKDFNAETITSLKLNVRSFFICGCQHHERKTICLYVYISDIRQIVGYTSIYSAVSLVSPYYNYL